MKLLGNLFNLFKIFIIFFIIFLCIYLFRVVDMNTLLKDFNINLIKRFIQNYLFYVFVVSSIISIIFVGTLNKLRGYIATALTIGLLSIIIISYPIYVLISKHDIEYLKSENTFLNINERTFTKVDEYIIKANNKLLDNGYKNGILIDTSADNKVYFADYIYVSNEVITMFDVKEINGTALENKNSVEIRRDSIFGYLSDISKNIVFGFNLIPFINLSLRYLTTENPQIYVIVILFSQFFIILFSLYMLGSAFSSKKYIYHNILSGFIIYSILQIIFTIANGLMSNLNFWNITAFIYFIAVFTIMLSFIFKRTFK